jgi:hypothetical protein
MELVLLLLMLLTTLWSYVCLVVLHETSVVAFEGARMERDWMHLQVLAVDFDFVLALELAET